MEKALMHVRASRIRSSSCPHSPLQIIYSQGPHSELMVFEASYATIIPVRNMDRAVKFYTQTLGGKLQQRDEGDMKDFWASVKVAGADFWLVSPEKREKRELS